jgi:hypothetical protein
MKGFPYRHMKNPLETSPSVATMCSHGHCATMVPIEDGSLGDAHAWGSVNRRRIGLHFVQLYVSSLYCTLAFDDTVSKRRKRSGNRYPPRQGSRAMRVKLVCRAIPFQWRPDGASLRIQSTIRARRSRYFDIATDLAVVAVFTGSASLLSGWGVRHRIETALVASLKRCND